MNRLDSRQQNLAQRQVQEELQTIQILQNTVEKLDCTLLQQARELATERAIQHTSVQNARECAAELSQLKTQFESVQQARTEAREQIMVCMYWSCTGYELFVTGPRG